MEREVIAAVQSRLEQTEAAHGEYERNVLGGIRDEEWAEWYSGYLLEHGFDALLPGVEDADALAALLQEADADYQREQPADGWPEYYAHRLVAAWG